MIQLEITKSGKRREIPMRQAAYEILTEVLAATPASQTRLFRGDIRKAFVSAVKRAKIEDFHFNDLRHTFASWFMMRGGDLYALKQILGHASITMTERYAHLAPDHLRSQMAKTERNAPWDPQDDAALQHKISTQDATRGVSSR